MTAGVGKLLTVSVAAYNVEKYLDEALRSCVVANMDALEVIIVDDGSEDKTSEVAREFVNRYPGTFVLIKKENGGYGSTFNASLKVARGKYFRYLDGDDWFDAGELEAYLAILSRNDSDVVYSPYVRVYESDGSSELIRDLRVDGEGVYYLSDLKIHRPLAACSLAYRTLYLREISFHMTEQCFYTDLEFCYIPFAFANSIYVSDCPLYRYRIGRNGQSISVEGIRSHYKDILKVRMRMLSEFFPDGGIHPDIVPVSYIRDSMVKEIIATYSYLLLVGSDASKQDALKFNRQLKGFSGLYRESSIASKKVRLLRLSRFSLFGWLSSRELRKK
ncbi:glycosyltransferase family 2 protein [Berryella intestinalis]|nr:glycosyltransferase family 2 protein [Berryella intestinalis]